MAGLKAQLGDLFGDLVTPARKLLIALAGVYLAILMFNGAWPYVGLIAVAGIFAGYLLEMLGNGALGKDRLRIGLALLEWWVLAPATIAAVATGLITYLGYTLAPDSLKGSDHEVAKALAAAITGFLSASFVDSAGDRDNTQLANRIKRAFLKAFEGRTPDADIVLKKLSLGWGWQDRRTRVDQLEKALRMPNPPSA